ncbi:MAG: sugar kinase [Phycisphaerales bacterium]|jgi:cytidine kinase|nr:sugar kinase [Phycisphaerales bacterium]MBT7171841.1 sugar kinase [Phycisphaerales bacterium]
MTLMVTGSIGIDTVEAPTGTAENILGGSSVYFAYAAGFFTPVRLVGVVGEDCPEGFLAPLEDNPQIDMTGLEVRAGSETFRWHGKYHDDVNQRDTLACDLGVLGEAGPKIPDSFRDSDYVFLANTHPALQTELLGQIDSPKLVVADTMDLWINTAREPLEALLGQIDGIILNDSEAILYTGNSNVIEAGLEIASKVRKFCVVKKGEHGAVLFLDGVAYPQPGYPATKVVDPTGAGDSFAGGMMGYLAASDDVSVESLCRAMTYGAMVASIELEDFSLSRMLTLTREEIDQRLAEFTALVKL